MRPQGVVNMKRDYKEVLSVIPEWPQTVTMKTAAGLLGWDGREFRQAVLDARKDGCLIGSNTNGYYLPSEPGDLLRFYKSKRKRALSALASLTPTRRALEAAGFDLTAKGGADEKGR